MGGLLQGGGEDSSLRTSCYCELGGDAKIAEQVCRWMSSGRNPKRRSVDVFHLVSNLRWMVRDAKLCEVASQPKDRGLNFRKKKPTASVMLVQY